MVFGTHRVKKVFDRGYSALTVGKHRKHETIVINYTKSTCASISFLFFNGVDSGADSTTKLLLQIMLKIKYDMQMQAGDPLWLLRVLSNDS